MTEALTSQVEKEFPKKQKAFITAQVDAKLKGSINKAEALELLAAMYPEGGETFRELSQAIDKLAAAELAQVKKEKGKEATPKVVFADFQKLILDHQLRVHIKFLSNLKQIFRSYDKENYGFVPKKEFESLLERLDNEKMLDRDSIMSTIDKNLWDTITFSDTVLLLSHHNIQKGGQKMSLLQYIFEGNA